jgi:hypothetical protein
MTNPIDFDSSKRCFAICPGSTLTDFHIAKASAAGKSVETLKTERAETHCSAAAALCRIASDRRLNNGNSHGARAI